jgi:hypothetical protein
MARSSRRTSNHESPPCLLSHGACIGRVKGFTQLSGHHEHRPRSPTLPPALAGRARATRECNDRALRKLCARMRNHPASELPSDVKSLVRPSRTAISSLGELAPVGRKTAGGFPPRAQYRTVGVSDPSGVAPIAIEPKARLCGNSHPLTRAACPRCQEC